MAVLSAKQLNAKIKSIGNNSVKLRDAIQDALISCAYYAIKDGDAGSFNRLLDAVGTNTRIKGITTWAELWGCVRMKDGAFVINKSARKDMSVTSEADFVDIEAMMRSAMPWYEIVQPEARTSIFDANAYLANVISKLSKEHQDDLARVIENAVKEYKIQKAFEDAKAA